MKKCRRCNKEKELNLFNFRKVQKGRYWCSYCRECDSLNTKASKMKRDPIINQNYNKEYYKKNKENIKLQHLEYRLSNPNIKKNYSRTIKSRFETLKSKVKINKIEFDISFEDYSNLLKQKCFYCENFYNNETGVGLDRINNNLGYLIKNVLSCCGKCNKTRGDRWTVEEMKIMINAVKNIIK
jgi:hypothetical protein